MGTHLSVAETFKGYTWARPSAQILKSNCQRRDGKHTRSQDSEDVQVEGADCQPAGGDVTYVSFLNSFSGKQHHNHFKSAIDIWEQNHCNDCSNSDVYYNNYASFNSVHLV